MPHHVIVDGSNLATEGRTTPSLKQLNEAVASYRADHPEVLMTVVVDATFGHRIDPKEVAAFEKAIDSNEFVAPPAGAVGRGDGFILNIAQKANASILSNDSYQEFHGEFAWLFDEGRLIGGKPVPHVGWVWVNRVPVRGPLSRRSVKEGKSVDKQPGRRRGAKANDAVIGSPSASAPMPIPKAPPPGAVMPTSKAVRDQAAKDEHARSEAAVEPGKDRSGGDRSRGRGGAVAETPREPAKPTSTTNDLLAFLSFVEHFPVGSAVIGVVETYSSHGAYVAIGDVHGYVPLRLMGDPAPRSAREAMDLGETVTLVVSSFGAARRSIDLAIPSMAPAVAPPPAKSKRGAKATSAPQLQVIADALAAAPAATAHSTHAAADAAVKAIPAATAERTDPTPATAASTAADGGSAKPAKATRARTQRPSPAKPAGAPSITADVAKAAEAAAQPSKKSRGRGSTAAAAAALPADEVVSPEARSRRKPRTPPTTAVAEAPPASKPAVTAPPKKAAPRKKAASAVTPTPVATESAHAGEVAGGADTAAAAPVKKAARRRSAAKPTGETS